ncbi:MAG: tRNA lysidine(34) synthetase TilS [Rhodocyclaceae bacterium]|nr:tRNA lysidine(34) synthetase TilS [Rhodocyclaceae bacterium]
MLLALLARCAAERKLSAIHVHHGLSPHADAWTEVCQDICAALKVPLEVVRISVPRKTGEGLEASARRLRYQAFETCAADYLLLAHHANDQAETLLFNLLRGAGVRGAAGIPAVSGRYLRPLLPFARAELEACAKQLGLRWVDDESNEDVSFSRNFIRHKVVPVLETRFPATVENLARAADHFAEAQEMLDEIARQDLGTCRDFPVPVALFAALSAPRARNVLRYLLALRGLQAPVTKRLEEALRQFIEAAPDRHPSLELPTYRLFRARGRIALEPR